MFKRNVQRKKLFCFALVFFVLVSINVFSLQGLGADIPTPRWDEYNYTDNRAPSQNPPSGLTPSQVPQFIVLGFDDNNSSSGMQWVTNFFEGKVNPSGTGNTSTFDGTPLRVSFYHPTNNFAKGLGPSWYDALQKGHEAGSHTHTHPHGSSFSTPQWESEISTSIDILTTPYSQGLGLSTVYGFRSPFLEYSPGLFPALKNLGVWYDCSIEEGWQTDQDGTNYLWPYTLDNRSPGNAASVELGQSAPAIGKYPGLWELPVYTVIVPPDEKCAQYGTTPGFRNEMERKKASKFNPADGKIVGFDWNLLYDFTMAKDQFAATLKYSLDLRLQGNRAPFTFGVHSNNYTSYAAQEGLKDFIEYALTKPDVRIVSAKQMLDWLRNPVPLSGTQTSTPNPTPTPAPGFTLSGYIAPDFKYSDTVASTLKSGFKVEIPGLGKSTITDGNGYFSISEIPHSFPGGDTIKISKSNYLYRQIDNINFSSNIQLGTKDSPVCLWAGDFPANGRPQDNAINMTDIMELVKSFNTTPGNPKYNADVDLNKDNAVNMTDIMTVVRHFNTTPANYPAVEIIPGITPTPVITTPTPTPVLTTPTPPTSVYPAWDASKVYVGGDKVSHSGKDYQAQWWTQGEEPGSASVWKEI